MIEKTKRLIDTPHQKWIRSLPCVMTGNYGVDFSHCDKWTNKGVGRKSDDDCGLPLTHAEHMDLHNKGTITYWGSEENARKALELARYLHSISGETDKALKAIYAFRRDLYDVF